jgi:ribosomal protein L7Ae-like RNA K-turn-binding protein
LRKVYNLIGIAQRAGFVSSGAMAAQTSLNSNRACILLMSNDIAENTRDLLVKKCMKNQIPWFFLGGKYELGNSTGKAYRVALTVNDEGMAGAIMRALEAAGMLPKSMGVDEWPR